LTCSQLANTLGSEEQLQHHRQKLSLALQTKKTIIRARAKRKVIKSARRFTGMFVCNCSASILRGCRGGFKDAQQLQFGNKAAKEQTVLVTSF